MEAFLQLLAASSPIERFLLIIGGVVLAYNGVIQIPYIKAKKKSKKSHKNCPLYSDLLAREKIKKDICNIRKKILKEQLHVKDSRHLNILFQMDLIYRGLTDNLAQIKHYEKIVQRIEYKVLTPMIETWLNENHLTNKPDWKAYKDQKIEMLLKTTIRDLTDDYDERFFDVTPTERSKANTEKLIPMVLIEWNAMFDEFREITRTYELKISELEKKLNK